MKVLVDTCIWSGAFRRDSDQNGELKKRLGELIAAHSAHLMGAIRQEILSGIRDDEHFKTLHARLAAFPDVPMATDDYVMAAKFFNLCRRKGIQGSNTDFLICAVAVRNRMAIYTSDLDFRAYAKVLPIVLSE